MTAGLNDIIVFDFEGQLRGEIAVAYAREAEKRGITPAELAVNILDTVAKDDLFLAVLDE